MVNQSSNVLFLTGNTLSFFVSSQRYRLTYLLTEDFGALTKSGRGQIYYLCKLRPLENYELLHRDYPITSAMK